MKARGSHAAKLGEFFEEDFEHMACGEVVLDTWETRRVSGELRRAGPVGREVMERYVKWWKKEGIL